MKTQPAWLDKNLFPFESKWIEIDSYQMHYVDDGDGDVILFVHGTPEWSFGYRDSIKQLSKKFRCIAPDYIGFGLSDKPVDGNYSCEAHARRLEKFIDKLQLSNITLVVNDFGGGIGLSYAITHPENVARFVLFNTWMWSLKDDSHYSGPAKVMNSWLGKFFYLQLNFPVNVIMPSAFGDRRKLTKRVHQHYKLSAGSSKERHALYAFAKELMNASDWWQSLWDQRSKLAGKPVLIFWGMKDKFIPPKELEKWVEAFPNAHVHKFEDAGHFVQEEKHEQLSRAIENFAA